VNRRRLWVLAGLAAVILLAGAVFLGARLLNSRTASGPDGFLAGLGGQGKGDTLHLLKLTPAPELPIIHADLIGLVFNVQDNSIFVDSGKTSISTGDGPSASGGATSTPSGPLIEVVVSQSTVIYRDITLDHVPEPQPGTTTITGVQQVVELTDISSIAQNSELQVWGSKRGDRLIAETIVVQGTDH
jgi:hypothetical protein